MPAKIGFRSQHNESTATEIEPDIDKIAREIENGSRDPFGLIGHQSPRKLVDPDILKGFADPDEVENEERILVRNHRSCPTKDADGCSEDFREHGIDGECRCIGDEQCQICCTTRDLIGVPANMYSIVEKRPGRIIDPCSGRVEEELVIGMLIDVAEGYGFL